MTGVFAPHEALRALADMGAVAAASSAAAALGVARAAAERRRSVGDIIAGRWPRDPHLDARRFDVMLAEARLLADFYTRLASGALIAVAWSDPWQTGDPFVAPADAFRAVGAWWQARAAVLDCPGARWRFTDGPAIRAPAGPRLRAGDLAFRFTDPPRLVAGAGSSRREFYRPVIRESDANEEAVHLFAALYAVYAPRREEFEVMAAQRGGIAAIEREVADELRRRHPGQAWKQSSIARELRELRRAPGPSR